MASVGVLRGNRDDHPLVQAFARHREQAERATEARLNSSGGNAVGEAREFNRGVLIAVSTLINCWGSGTETEHLLNMIEADRAMVESMDFTDYDRGPLLAALAHRHPEAGESA